MKKEDTIIYDIVSCPNSWNLDTLFEVYKNASILFWDSGNGGNEPKLLTGKKLEFSLDIAIPENKKLLEKLQKELKDEK